MKFYAFVEYKTNEVGRFGNILGIGYVTESILKRGTNRVKVYGSNYVKYVQRNKFITIIPLY